MEDLVTVLVNTILLTGIWWLYFFGYRQYRLDKTRQSLFEIRDRLFEEWTEKQLPFDSRAYVIMRTTMNGMIQFAHRLSMIRVIAAIVADQQFRNGAGAKRYESQLKTALSSLPREAREVVDGARMEMHFVMVEHIVKSSILVRVLMLTIAVFQITNVIMSKLTKRWSATIDAEAENIGHGQCHSRNGLPA